MGYAHKAIKLLLLAAFGLVGGLLAGAVFAPPPSVAQGTQPDVIEAEGFRLVDADGNRRFEMRVDEDLSAGIEMWDGDGLKRGALALMDGGYPFIEFIDSADHARMLARVSYEQPIICAYDEDLHHTVEFSHYSDAEGPAFALYEGEDVCSFVAGVAPDGGNSSVELYGSGRRRAGWWLFTQAGPRLFLNNAGEHEQVQLGLHGDMGPAVMLLDQTPVNRAQAFVSKEFGPHLATFGPERPKEEGVDKRQPVWEARP